MKILKSARGQGTMSMALLLMFLAGAGVTAFLNKGELLILNAKKVQKDLIARQDFNKIFSIGNFLVANNFILCKTTAWDDGGIPPMNCKYNAISDLAPSKFALINQTREGRDSVLTFEVDLEAIGAITREDVQSVTTHAKVSFQLVDIYKNQLYEQMVGKLTEAQKKINLDHYVVVQKVELKVTEGKGKKKVDEVWVERSTRLVVREIGMSRPIAIPKLRVDNSVCAAKCEASLSENPYVACRGAQTVDEDSTTDINITLINMGPGVLFGLSYAKRITYRPSDSRRAVERDDSSPEFNIFETMGDDEFIMPDVSHSVVDSARCRRFINVTSNANQRMEIYLRHSQQAGSISYSIQVANSSGNEGKGNYMEEVILDSSYNPVDNFFNQVLFSTAHAAEEESTSSCSSDATAGCADPMKIFSDASLGFDGYTDSVYVSGINAH